MSLEASIETEVHAEIAYAGFWRRLLAYLIDFVILTIIFFIMDILLRTITVIDLKGYSVLFCVISLLYYGILESSSKQATLGKQIMKIKVIDYEYQQISLLRAFARSFFVIVPLQISSVLLLTKTLSTVTHLIALLIYLLSLIFFLAIIWTKRSQGFHDLFTACLVIRRT